jgi:hypothetical protein
MGYSLYITRGTEWFGEGPQISIEEWRGYVEQDPELRFDESLGKNFVVWSGPSKRENPWLWWQDGHIESKYPDAPLVRKMHAIAEALEAKVQGEDGEEYDAAGDTKPSKKPSWRQRIRRWWVNATAKGATPVDPATLPFKVGDRVRSIVGPWYGTVTAIDVRAEHGLGRITVRRDSGSIINQAAIAHGLLPVEKSEQ